MKSQIRVLGIDDASFTRDDEDVLLIGTLYRGGDFLDGVMTCKVKRDGTDSTSKLMEMINASRSKPQLRAVLLKGIAVAGFNVVDVFELHRSTGVPVIVVMRGYPEIKKMRQAMARLGMQDRLDLIDKAGEIRSFRDIHYQAAGALPEDAEEILRITSTHAAIPEPLRIAHIIGQGIFLGESKGKA